MKFCSECAHPVALMVPPDDTRLRHVCGNCGTVHYENPKMVIGSIPLWFHADDGRVRILLCRRAIEPRLGFWTLPAGFMENNETTGAAAARETVEESGARIELHGLFSLLNVPHVHQVHMFYLATLLDLDYQAGVESLEVRMFAEEEIPWADIAFPTIRHTLEFLFADLARLRREGVTARDAVGMIGGSDQTPGFGFHTLDLFKPMRLAD
jgi:ADP-ribose pyrophosphatase YjhB (NUDIX family)